MWHGNSEVEKYGLDDEVLGPSLESLWTLYEGLVWLS